MESASAPADILGRYVSSYADVRFHMQANYGFLWALILCCGGVFATMVFLFLLWKHHPSYGANPNGPSFPLIGILPFVLLNKHQLYEWCCFLFDRSPSLTLRLNTGRSSISVATVDPQVVHHILKTHFPSYPKGPSFYPFFAELLGNGIFNCDGALWRFQRKVASHVFTSNSLKNFVMAVADAEIVSCLLPTLANNLDADAHIDLQALLMLYTFDTICQLTFGSDPACLDGSKFKKTYGNCNISASTHVTSVDDRNASLHISYARVPDQLIQGFVQGFQVALQITADRFLIPDFVWKTKRFFKIGSEKKLIDAMEQVDKFASFVIELGKQELASGKDRKDLLARFIRLAKEQTESLDHDNNSDKQEGMVISDSLLKDILLSFILAGRESIASGVTFSMWLICVHPIVEREVLKEIAKILEGRKSNDAGKTARFTYEEVRKMNYLHGVLSESMRLYPPVPSNCKFAAQDDVFPDGTPVLKGSQVSYNVFAMGRAARVWGEDCREFRPERWLDENGVFVPASPFKYPIFQAGPRICLGKDFAFIQMKLLVASLIQEFEFAVQPGFKPKLSYGVNMMMTNGLPVTLKRRSTLPC
ncbi:hypothetical protein GOP47_0009089 [Adiantum capillus-veneris]|uniref:Cytochrome P450 n=1 Tax=Adiantum capillus-veneris TaxID=13818 RepID=A0A9D4UZU4_ADICA|nr:hypothetical protein GOP47_0009089 [Adiantum capillus-veneris]